MTRLNEGNPNLRESLKLAKELGCDVKRKDGEVVIRHPSQPRPIHVNARRKSTPRKLVTYLRRLVRSDLA